MRHVREGHFTQIHYWVSHHSIPRCYDRQEGNETLQQLFRIFQPRYHYLDSMSELGLKASHTLPTYPLLQSKLETRMVPLFYFYILRQMHIYSFPLPPYLPTPIGPSRNPNHYETA